MSDELTLGEKLRLGVINLWKTVNGHGKILDHHGREIEDLRRRMNDYDRQLHSLRTSRGIQRARNQRLEVALDEAEQKLTEIRNKLDG